MISKDFLAGYYCVLRFLACGNCISDDFSKIVAADFVVRSDIFDLNVVHDEIALDGDITVNDLIGLR